MTEHSFCLDDAFDDLPLVEAVAWCDEWLQNHPNAPQDHQNMVKFAKKMKEQLKELKDESSERAKKVTFLTDELKESKDESSERAKKVTFLTDELILLKDEARARSLGSLRENNLVLMDRTDSRPHYPDQNHLPATLVSSDMKTSASSFDTWLRNNNVTTSFWETGLWPESKKISKINCDSESFTATHVLAILTSVVRGLGLNTVVELVLNRSIAGVECDILLVCTSNRLPFATIEIKKPGAKFDDLCHVFVGKLNEESKDIENHVAGQILDQCNAIKLFGFTKVFGLITTGNMWRMVCTPPTTTANNDNGANTSGEGGKDSSDEEDGLPRLAYVVACLECPKALSQGEQNGNHNNNATNVTSTTVSPERPSIVFNDSPAVPISGRTLYATMIVPAFPSNSEEYQSLATKVSESGNDVVALVACFILRACSGLVEFFKASPVPTIEISSSMACRILSNNEQTFAFGTVVVEKLQLNVFFQKPSTQKIYVIHHIGRGEYGNCCLGVSFKGASTCVVKFFHRGDTDKAADNELQNWKNVYPAEAGWPTCAVRKVAGGRCLIMPYVHPLPASGRRTLLDDGSITNALEQFSRSGFIHLEPKWRHIGKWKDILIFIDLGLIKNSTTEEIETWKAKTMADLRATAEPLPSHPTGKSQNPASPASRKRKW